MHLARWFAVGLAVAVVAAVGFVALSGGDDADPLQAFCNDASDELDGLSGSGTARAAALARLDDAAPEELAEFVAAASRAESDTASDEMFVVPGDPSSDVRADVAADLWHERVTAGQAWDRVERVLVGDCELDLDEGAR